MKPLGYRNLNPLNIRYNVMNDWKGQTGSNKGFCTFDTIEHGFRAAFVLLLNYIKRGYDTPTEIISRWAPASENDTKAYIASVMRYYSYSISDDCYAIDADMPITDVIPYYAFNKLTLFALCMSYVELGIKPYDPTDAQYVQLWNDWDSAKDDFEKEFWKNKGWISILNPSGMKPASIEI